MNLTDELRALPDAAPAPDFSAAILARIEDLEPITTGLAITDWPGASARRRVSMWPMLGALASVGAGVVLVLLSGLTASIASVPRLLTYALPVVNIGPLGTPALIVGLTLYLSGLWLSIARPDAWRIGHPQRNY